MFSPRRLPVRVVCWFIGGLMGVITLPAALFAFDALSATEPPENAQHADTVDASLSRELPRDFDSYIYRQNGVKADPINVIFRSSDADKVAEAIERVLGWRPIRGSQMAFHRAAGTRLAVHQLGSVESEGSRLHIRIEATPSDGTATYVLAAVHRDETVPCGHVGRAFDETRDLVARAFATAGYDTYQVDLGNREPGDHCDASRIGGDGHAVVVDLMAP